MLALHGGSFLTFDVDPFLQYGQYATDSAYPHSDSPLPVCSIRQHIALSSIPVVLILPSSIAKLETR